MHAIAKVQAWFTRIDQWLHHHYGRRPLVGVAVALGGALLVVIFQYWLSSSALPYVWSGIKQLVALPVGVFGVALFLLLAAFAVAAFVDTSPTASAIKQFRENRSKTKADLPPLPAGERDAINDIRKFWKKHIVGSEVDNAGDLHGAWFELHRSVLTLVEANAAKCAFVRLLKEEIGHAEVAFHTVHTETLADGSRIPLKAKAGNERDVSGDLVAFFWRYGNLVRWLHEFPFVILGLRDDET